MLLEFISLLVHKFIDVLLLVDSDVLHGSLRNLSWNAIVVRGFESHVNLDSLGYIDELSSAHIFILNFFLHFLWLIVVYEVVI